MANKTQKTDGADETKADVQVEQTPPEQTEDTSIKYGVIEVSNGTRHFPSKSFSSVAEGTEYLQKQEYQQTTTNIPGEPNFIHKDTGAILTVRRVK